MSNVESASSSNPPVVEDPADVVFGERLAAKLGPQTPEEVAAFNAASERLRSQASRFVDLALEAGPISSEEALGEAPNVL